MKRFKFILLFLVFVVQSPVAARQAARTNLKTMNVAFTSEAFIQSVVEGNKATAELFLASGMSPNTAHQGEPLEVGDRVIQDGDTVLLIALVFGHEDIVSLLIEKHADVNQSGSFGTLPISVAKGQSVRNLLDNGADPNKATEYGRTALMSAASDGDLEKLTLLLDHGATINAKDQTGSTALRFVAAQRHREVVRFLIERGADLSGYSDRALRLITSPPDEDDEVMQVIGKLNTRLDTTGSIWKNTGPSLEDQKQVPRRLLEMADRSAESRSTVIDRLIDVVEDPAEQEAGVIANAWVAAVRVLGTLRATEAIDALVANLNRTGQNGIRLSIHFRPVYSALVKIGKPALPKLVAAIHHPEPSIRIEAAWLLCEIDKDKAQQVLEVAVTEEKEEEVRKEFNRIIDRNPPKAH